MLRSVVVNQHSVYRHSAYRRSVFWVAIATCILPLTSCANGTLGSSLERSLSADPQLANNPDLVAGDEGTILASACDPSVLDQLPESFPAALCYPNATLLDSSTPESGTPSDSVANAESEGSDAELQATGQTSLTQWQTADAASQVEQFYRDRLATTDWDITALDEGNTPEAQPQDLEARKDGNLVLISFENADSEPVSPGADNADQDAAEAPSASTTFRVEFRLAAPRNGDGTRLTEEAARLFSQIDPTDSSTGTRQEEGETPTANRSTATQTSTTQSAQSFTDLNNVPDDLRRYITDLAALGVLTSSASASATNRSASVSSEFNPNTTITRRDYARWLLNANNILYGDRPSRKIRLATGADQPAFQDVPQSDPDFEVIQGLAEAGLIPSPLSGESAAQTFRPDAPLTRETLLTWKVPLDRRGSLPTATVDAIQQTWGFQDANQINPNALRAILADYQNGDNANILRAFGYTTLFQPQKSVTRAEAAAALWFFGYQGDGVSAQDALNRSNRSDSSNRSALSDPL